MTTLAPTPPSRPPSGGIFVASQNAERLQAISDAIHEMHLAAAAYSAATPHTWEQASAGMWLDCVLTRIKTLKIGGAA